MVECGICLEEYQEGDLELHRQMCVVRLMFRCSLCGEDYVSKEGLWNHLDLHEIADESKELHYQEVKAKHKLHQCVLCNDQRAYLESAYWKHIHDVHDRFFLRCSDCEESFRSEKLKNDYVSSHCNARYQVVASDVNVLQEEQVPIKVENLTCNAEHLKLLREEQGLRERLGVNLNAANDADINVIDKESELPTVNSTPLTCPKHAKEHDDSQFGAENSLIHDVKEGHTNSMVVLQNKNIELRLDIKVEETMLQEQEDQAPNEVPEISFDPTWTRAKHYVPVKTCSFEDAELFVKNFEFGFCLSTKSNNRKGSNRYYRCTRIKKYVRPQCKRKVWLFTPNKNEKSTVCAKGEHSCINASPENLTLHAQIDLVYVPVKTCSLEDAKSFVENFEFGFACRGGTDRAKGKTRHYRCTRIVRPQCDRKVLIFTPDVNEESIICATGEHSCINAPPEQHLTVHPKVHRQIGSGYVPIETCSLEDAKLFVKNFEFGFSFNSKNVLNMRYYRCSRLKSKVRPQCERKVLIFTPNAIEKSMVFAKGEHSCIHAPPKNLTRAKLSLEQADTIQKLVKAGVPKKDVKDHTNLLEARVYKKQSNHAVKNVSKRLEPRAEPRYKCSFCPRMFDFARSQHIHEKSCSELQCDKCSVKFTRRCKLYNHYKHKHPHDGKLKDVHAEDAEDLDNTIKVKEEYPEDGNRTT